MLDPLVQSLVAFVELLFRSDLGSNEFHFMLGAGLVGFLFTGQVVSAMFGSDQGTIASIFALALPILFGLIAYAAVDVYAVPHLKEYPLVAGYLPEMALGLVLFVSTLTISTACWGIGRSFVVLTYLLSLAVAVAAIVMLAGVLSLLGDSVNAVDKL